ncbi:unnamed protein product, partial [Allacma fusca]
MYVIVEFSGEPKVYSVIPSENIIDGSIRGSVKSHLGKKLKISWGKRHYDVTLRYNGTKKQMDKLCDDLAIKAAEMDDKSKENVTTATADVSKKSNKRKQEQIGRSKSIVSVLNKRTKRQVTPNENIE